METVFLLTMISYIALTDVFEATIEGGFPSGEECIAAGTALVVERSDEIAAAGAEGAVWFHCTEALGQSFGDGE
jgi:hypothetical protein